MKLNIFLLTIILGTTCFGVKATYLKRRIIGFLPHELKQKANEYDVRDYAHDSKVQQLLVEQRTLQNKCEQAKKEWENEKSNLGDKVLAEADFIEKMEEVNTKIQQSPLFGIAIPSAALLIESTPQELLAFIDHYRIDKASFCLKSKL